LLLALGIYIAGEISTPADTLAKVFDRLTNFATRPAGFLLHVALRAFVLTFDLELAIVGHATYLILDTALHFFCLSLQLIFVPHKQPSKRGATKNTCVSDPSPLYLASCNNDARNKMRPTQPVLAASG
jgi:hypothetical protein